MYRHDAQGTNVGKSGPNNMSVRWKFPTGGQVIGSAAIVNQKVYIGSYDKNLYCLDLWTGKKIWNYTTGLYIGWSPAVVGGKVYTGADDGIVYCLNAESGALIWKKQITEFAPANMSARYSYATASPLIYGDKLYIGGVDGKEYCLNINDGSILWSFDTAPGAKTAFITNLKSSGTIGPDGSLYVVGSPTSTAQKYQIYKLNAKTGEVILQWRMPYTSYPPSTDTIFATPLVVGDKLFIADHSILQRRHDHRGSQRNNRTSRLEPLPSKRSLQQPHNRRLRRHRHCKRYRQRQTVRRRKHGLRIRVEFDLKPKNQLVCNRIIR
jgi:outer membrane protein assembly factor BamB